MNRENLQSHEILNCSVQRFTSLPLQKCDNPQCTCTGSHSGEVRVGVYINGAQSCGRAFWRHRVHALVKNKKGEVWSLRQTLLSVKFTELQLKIIPLLKRNVPCSHSSSHFTVVDLLLCPCLDYYHDKSWGNAYLLHTIPPYCPARRDRSSLWQWSVNYLIAPQREAPVCLYFTLVVRRWILDGSTTIHGRFNLVAVITTVDVHLTKYGVLLWPC
jgi:hypothetical protein